MAASINLRAFPLSTDVKCPHCYQIITVYDVEGCEYLVCNHCNSYLHKSAAGTFNTIKQLPKISAEPLIPLGTEGIINDIAWKHIAYMEKKELATEYRWREYMLYNYTKGYAFLVEYDGHWTIVAGKALHPELDHIQITDDNAFVQCDGVEYSLFNKYVPVITGLVGEFDWDVFDERVNASEYINPPYLMVREKDNRSRSTVNFYLGEYIKDQDVATAFKLDISTFPVTEGYGANEPSPYAGRWKHVLKLSIAFAVLVICIQIILTLLKPEKVILQDTYPLSLAQTGKVDSTGQGAFNAYSANVSGNFELKAFRTTSFQVTSGTNPVEVDLASPIDNNWFEATIELVSEKDNQTWNVSKELEYYHGYEDGESWSEGSNNESLLLSSVPSGRYHLNVYPYSGNSLVNSMDIKVVENVTLWQNLFITLLIICIYPFYCWYRMRRFETNRWMNSDYSPYKKTESE